MRAILTDDEHNTILDEIEGLLVPADGEREPGLARVEHTLTAGYAHVLALEAERLRLERRLGELAAALTDDASADDAAELAELGRLISRADRSLSSLRALLASLRERAHALRTDRPPAAA